MTSSANSGEGLSLLETELKESRHPPTGRDGVGILLFCILLGMAALGVWDANFEPLAVGAAFAVSLYVART